MLPGENKIKNNLTDHKLANEMHLKLLGKKHRICALSIDKVIDLVAHKLLLFSNETSAC